MQKSYGVCVGITDIKFISPPDYPEIRKYVDRVMNEIVRSMGVPAYIFQGANKSMRVELLVLAQKFESVRRERVNGSQTLLRDTRKNDSNRDDHQQDGVCSNRKPMGG